MFCQLNKGDKKYSGISSLNVNQKVESHERKTETYKYNHTLSFLSSGLHKFISVSIPVYGLQARVEVSTMLRSISKILYNNRE